MSREIGINQSNLLKLGEDDLYRVLDDIQDFGFQSVRFAIDWGYWSNFLGATNYDPARRVAKAFQIVGLTPLPVLGIHYPWNHSASAFGNHVKKVVGIFGQQPYYEVWNEPNIIAFDIGGPSSYLKYLRAAVGPIRESGSLVISAGLAAFPDWQSPLGRNYAPTTWLQKMIDAGLGVDDFDLFGYHPYSIKDDQYSTFVDPRTEPFGIKQVPALESLLLTKFPSGFAFTEVGFDTGKIMPETAAAWLTAQFNEYIAINDKTWLFCWRDTDDDGGKYGLVDKNNVPKGAYYEAAKNILAQ